MEVKINASEMLKRIDWINEVAKTDFGVAKGMLEMLNSLCGTKYAFLAKRVIRFDNPEIGYHSPCHDLHAELWYEVEFLKDRKDA